MWESILIVTILLFLSAFFSASEIAIMSVPIYKVKQLLYEKQAKLAKILLYLRENTEKTLITILIWNNLVNVILSVYSAKIWDHLLSNFALAGAVWMIIISIVVTFFILLFWEIIPKVFASKFSLQFALFIAPIIKWLYYLLFFIVIFFEWIVFLFNKIFWENHDKVSKQDIEVFVTEWRKEWLFSEIESMIIKNLLLFEEKELESVLKHRIDVFALNKNLTLQEAIQKVLKHGYSRIPVYSDNIDNIIWIITIRDMLQALYENGKKQVKLSDLKLKPALKIPITAKLLDTFIKMKKTGFHFAIVLDEYWWVQGIITFEDILEELVWDIKDETDINETSEIIQKTDNSITIKWNVTLRQALFYLWYRWKINLTKEEEDMFSEDDMLSYIILAKLSRFAKKWDVVIIDNFKISIESVEKNRIKTLKVEILDK